MDVEGHELAVLHGAERLLSEARVGALAFEYLGGLVPHRLRDLWAHLEARGFHRFFRIVHGGRLLPVPAYRPDLETPGLANYVAVRTESLR